MIAELDLGANPFVPPTDKCPVNDLPPEVLAHIFTVGTAAQEEGDDPDEDVEEEVEEDDGDDNFSDVPDDDDDDDEVEFQVLVSHVCRHWRQVATQTPALWTHLTFEEPPPFEKSQVWIERSKGCPLVIEVDATKPEPDALDLDDDDDEGGGEGGGGDERAQTSKEMDQLSLDDMAQILALLVPHVARWQRVEIMVSDFALMHLALTRFAACAGAPLLETLQLYHYEDCESYDTFEPRALRAALLPFRGNAPRLAEVALWGVHVDWADTRLLAGLRALELAYHAKDVRPAFADLAAILRNCPHLDALTLCCSGPLLPEDGVDGWPAAPLALPALRNLVLAFQEPDYAAALARRLYTPALESLTLDFESEDYTDFVKQLSAPVLGPPGAAAKPQSMLAGVKNLKISGLPCAQRAIEDFYRALPNLQSLNLNLNHVDLAFFFYLSFPTTQLSTRFNAVEGQTVEEVILQNIRSQRAADPAHVVPVFCPLLETLTTTGVNGKAMSAWIEQRTECGFPIKRLFMNDEDEVLSKDQEFLKAQVEEFDFFEGSDDDEIDDIEMEDDEEDET